MSKVKIFDGMAIHQVMAFNAVSAPAYVGKAVGLIVDCSMDDEPDIQVIITARTDAELQRFHDLIGQKVDLTKSKEVAIAWTAYLRVRDQANIPNAEHGVLNPNHRDLDDEL